MSVPKAARTALYRLFGGEGQLLYVGITNSPDERFVEHRRDKRWWDEVVTREIEWHPDRTTALIHEARAIRREAPLYNLAGSEWPHQRIGKPPAETVNMTTLRTDPGSIVDRVAESKRPVIVTRSGVPLAVVVPYFAEETS